MYRVLKYIHEHIHEDLSLTLLAEKFGYSKWHFCTKFHAYTGKSFSKYIRHFRLHLAALDILDDRKITEIAMMYGYDTVSGFNKAFLTEFGCCPSEYKKQAKEALLYYERRKLQMYALSDRIDLLLKDATAPSRFEDRFCVQHRVYTALGQHEALRGGASNTETITAGLVRLLDRFAPVIRPHELIVGFNFSDEKFGERFEPENTEVHRELMVKNGISQKDIHDYFALEQVDNPKVSPRILEAEENMRKEWTSVSLCLSWNHTVIGYKDVLQLGYRGLLEKVERYEQENGSCELYTAAKAICLAACEMGKKYAAEAQRLLDTRDPDYVAADLENIIRTCQRVPEFPATTLQEAIQALWFAHIINTWEDYINANSLGRLDQILYPYYKSDIEKGILTEEEAFELICCLWIKLYRSYDVQQSCVGGTDASGESQVNELSYIMLDATEQLDFVRCLSVRYSKKTEKAFLQRALEVVGHVQKGIPFFFNDDVMIPALEGKGISHEDAADYTQIGCVETVIPGASNPHAVTGRTNLLKALEYTLCNGFSMMYPEMENGVQTGELSSLNTFEKFYDAVLIQIQHILDVTCCGVSKHQKCAAVNDPKPYKSLLTQGCLESGKDFNDAGAKYDYYQIMLGGIPNLADSLEVIRKFVYEEQKYTLSQLRDILIQNYPDEAVRLEFVNKAPKFGNDIDSVDSLAVDIIDRACDMLEMLSEKYGLSFHPQPFTFLWMVDYGEHSAASPDGRRKGEVIAYSLSPMQGRDFNGLTALFNSLSKIHTKRTPGTTSAIVEIDPKLFTDRNIPMLTDILLAASAEGLNNVQFNTIDADMLESAKKHPEKYNNLAVRVSGFSQKFNLLTPELQDHIIARTKHTCL